MTRNFVPYRLHKHIQNYRQGWHTTLLMLCVLGLWQTACTAIPRTSTPLAEIAEITEIQVTTKPLSATAEQPASQAPTLEHFWEGNARFEVEIEDTKLPMGESDTVILADGTWRTYVHASYPALGVLDQCGAPVEFPGCLVLFNSTDGGKSFAPTVNSAGAPICQIPCTHCPCDSRRDHIDQQQYPRVAAFTWHDRTNKITGEATDPLPNQQEQWVMTYEYRANTILRHSADGLNWSPPRELPLTGIWQDWLMPCRPEGTIGTHPYAPSTYDCLVGSPPGIYIDEKIDNGEASAPELFIFVGLGQNPSGMGCYRGPVNGPPALLRVCDHNPLFVGASAYGPLEAVEGGTEDQATLNDYFDFRTISSADLIHIDNRYYLLYEGVRGPGPGDEGDTQFLLGLARSTSEAIDGPWELYPANPILLDLPGNVGVGHADVVMAQNGDEVETYLYTSLDGEKRSRLRLVWK